MAEETKQVSPSQGTKNFLVQGLDFFYPTWRQSSEPKWSRNPFWEAAQLNRDGFNSILFEAVGTNILSAAIVKIKEILTGKAEGNMPEELDQLLADYDQHLLKETDSEGQKQTKKETIPEIQTKIGDSVGIEISTTPSVPPVSLKEGEGFLISLVRSTNTGPLAAGAQGLLGLYGFFSKPPRSLTTSPTPAGALAYTLQTYGLSPRQIQAIIQAQNFDIRSLEMALEPFKDQKVSFPRLTEIAYRLQVEVGVTNFKDFQGLKPGPGQTLIFFNPNASGRNPALSLAGEGLRFLTKKLGQGVLEKVAAGAGIEIVGAAGAGALTGGIGAIVMVVVGALRNVWDWIKTKIKKEEGGELGGTLFLVGLPIMFLGLLVNSLPLATIGGLSAASGLILGGAQVAITGAASLFNTFVFGITNLVLPSIAAPLIISFISIPVIVALILFIINSGAYMVPPQVGFLTPGTVIESPYIAISKNIRVDQNRHYENRELPLIGISYTVEVRARRGTLTNVNFENTCQVIREEGKSLPGCSAPLPPEIPETISPTEVYTFTYTQDYTSPDFADSFVVDTFTVTADVTEDSGNVTQTTAASAASLVIGDPPATFPHCWPVLGEITQGRCLESPGGSHCKYIADSESVDIAVAMETPVYATHNGIVVGLNTNQNAGDYGVYVRIRSPLHFDTVYAHLQSVTVQLGQPVAAGMQIGSSDDTGNSTGPHLHYSLQFPQGAERPFTLRAIVPDYVVRGNTEGCFAGE